MKIKLLSIILLLCFISCKKNSQSTELNGIYTEKYPISRRSQLEFATGNILIKTEIGSSFKDSFKYKINGEIITLTPTWTTQYSGTDFTFKISNSDSFQISNLYPSIPSAPPILMTYQK
ncbi:MAG: hypothetical protein M3004_01315 [Bacteroidota bacterium]|nr:hypothetical protein [Bacteroidota bacterium]